MTGLLVIAYLLVLSWDTSYRLLDKHFSNDEMGSSCTALNIYYLAAERSILGKTVTRSISRQGIQFLPIRTDLQPWSQGLKNLCFTQFVPPQPRAMLVKHFYVTNIRISQWLTIILLAMILYFCLFVTQFVQGGK